MKQLLTLLIISMILPGFSQDSWKELPANTHVPSFSPGSSYDIATGQNGTSYLVYSARKDAGEAYSIYVDAYTLSDGWSTLATFPTFNQPAVSVKTLQIGSAIYLMANTGPGNRLTLFEISGTDVFELDAEDFPELKPKSDWKLYPGKVNEEICFAYDDRLYQFNYVTTSWNNMGNAFAGMKPDPLELALAAVPFNRRRQVNTRTNRTIVGYVIADSSRVTLEITNNSPVFTSGGIVPDMIFGSSYTNLLSALQVKDADDDDIRLESVVSSNKSVIDPELVQVSLYNSMHGLTMVSVDAIIGQVVAVEKVTLTFSFTDGFDTLERVIIYTVQPNPQK